MFKNILIGNTQFSVMKTLSELLNVVFPESNIINLNSEGPKNGQYKPYLNSVEDYSKYFDNLSLLKPDLFIYYDVPNVHFLKIIDTYPKLNIIFIENQNRFFNKNLKLIMDENYNSYTSNKLYEYSYRTEMKICGSINRKGLIIRTGGFTDEIYNKLLKEPTNPDSQVSPVDEFLFASFVSNIIHNDLNYNNNIIHCAGHSYSYRKIADKFREFNPKLEPFFDINYEELNPQCTITSIDRELNNYFKDSINIYLKRRFLKWII